MTDARRFRSAGDGGQRGAPATGAEFQFSGSRERTSRRLKGLLAAKRYQQRRGQQQGESAPQSRSINTPGELSAQRGAYRQERRFDDERGFYDPTAEEPI